MKFVLEKGEAKKDFIDMTPAERIAVAERIFKRVVELAASIGQKPVLSKIAPSREKNLSL